MGQMKPNTLTGDPYVNRILDFCHGHTGGQGDYHFHAAPECLIQHPDGSEEHYNIVGFALDGYPLIAHYKSVLDASRNPVLDAGGETQFDWLETSGYEPNSAYKTQVLEGGGTSTYAWDNYEYDVNRPNRTLDEGNGRILTDNIIKDGLSERAFFNFDYGYFITGEFPYFIAKYRGEVSQQNQRPGAGGPKGQRPGAGDPKGQQRLPADIQQGSVRVISTQNNETSVSTRFIVTQPDGIRQVLLVLRDAPAVGNQRLGGGVFTFNPPQDFVPNPIHLGSKWISSNNDGVIKIKTERKVVKVETVTVPAGTFQRCLKISEDVVVTRGNNQKRNLSYMWLAKNVGPVKLINPDEEVFQLAEYNTVLAVKKRDQHLSAVWGRVKSRF